MLQALVDERRVGTSEPLSDASAPVDARLLRPTSRNRLSGPAVAMDRLHMAGRKLVSLAGSGS